MKVLVVGGGGREHAIIKKLKENSSITEIFAAPGNGGMAKDATCVNIGAKDIDAIVAFAVETGETVYTDVYDLLDPARAMFYGAGFAGDLLLIGAEPIQGQETLIAIDTNTMEVVDLGVKASISYGISEEMDGKVYFVLSGLGLHYIDVATREVKPANGAKDMLIPVRCCARSFVELEDPMYPGPSIVTYNGKGVGYDSHLF